MNMEEARRPEKNCSLNMEKRQEHSIKEIQVFQLFCKIGYNTDVSAILANLCTYEDALPQGAVTSPYIANLVTYHLDATFRQRKFAFCKC